ncbi:response Regulator Receiver Signal Transduction Histidine Kinase [Cystobacter fuscus DSM 2262]|uniref:Response Regulator Receiver Signal Transduction Histidine Kinase n=1 Tax=Cystobacter fuscus (strain ATCC 25194 / DSM 2262 / NBRC 100088 / M29) TaxID=1242864 RepID=S9QMD1_CYSF2|nr:response regulator [Cystobacter fuscus]EPX62449.1 response Regulator Receiver Signal Transduction Histidine Kinase [Cystobacter fuscus DSM 2262]
MTDPQKRILVIDDSSAIHKDVVRILCPEHKSDSGELDLLEDALFGMPSSSKRTAAAEFEVDSAFQGQEGLAKVKEAQSSGHPYELVFLDYRMPPGWNGVETLRHLRQVAPSLRVVLCSAYCDYTWEDIRREFGESDLLLELRKPFNSQKLRQLALELTGAQHA